MMVFILISISSMKGTASPTCIWTKCRLHFWAIFRNVSHAISCTPSCVSKVSKKKQSVIMCQRRARQFGKLNKIYKHNMTESNTKWYKIYSDCYDLPTPNHPPPKTRQDVRKKITSMVSIPAMKYLIYPSNVSLKNSENKPPMKTYAWS